MATTVCWNRLHNMLNSDREAQYNFTLKFMNVSWVGRAHRCILKHHPLINEDLDGINIRESSCFNANTRWFANSLRAISSNPCIISMEMVYRFFFLDYFKIQNIIDKIITSFQWLLFYYNTILFFLNNLYTISSNFIVISMKMIYRFFLDFLRILVQNVIDKINPFNTISIKYFPPLFVTRFLNSLEHYKILT